MSSLSGIYKITNILNGDFYIGSSKNITRRWREHLYIARNELRSTYLYAAIRKYSEDAFIFEFLEECEPIREILLEREQVYLDNLLPKYNIQPTAGSNLGAILGPHTEKWKQENGIRASEFMNRPENKEKYRLLRFGKTYEELFGEEEAQRIKTLLAKIRSEKPTITPGWNRGIPMTEEQKQKLNTARLAWIEAGGRPSNTFEPGHVPWNVGIPCSEETKRLISENRSGVPAWNKGIPMSDEQKQKLSEAHTGQNLGQVPWNKGVETGARSEETKQKISESHRTSAARQAVYEARKGYEWTDEQRAQISEGNKTSEKAKAYHQGRIGKSRGNNPSGHYGVIWDKSRNKWQVRVAGKSYGRFENLDEAIRRSDEIVNNEMSLSHVT